MVTGRFVPIVRAFWHLAVTSVLGFLAALGLFAGYICGLAFLAIALLKPIFPNNVGFWSVNGKGISLGIKFATDQMPAGGYWVILIGLFLGLASWCCHIAARVAFSPGGASGRRTRECLGCRSSE